MNGTTWTTASLASNGNKFTDERLFRLFSIDPSERFVGTPKLSEEKRTPLPIETAVKARGSSSLQNNVDEFALVAAHELHEPLRTITSYLRLIEKKNESLLDAESKDYLHFAIDAARRLRDLIDDILVYSTVGAKQLNLDEVDSGMCLANALGSLREAVSVSQAQVCHGSLPKLHVPKRDLERLFQNLVGNAIKYCSQIPPVVQVSAEREGDGWMFTVADNGLGIATDAQPRIFEMFHRLHGKSEIPGTGIGLAICKKIVEQWRGRIWVESVPGMGSRFRFTVPDSN